jgi:hypothetical protein
MYDQHLSNSGCGDENPYQEMKPCQSVTGTSNKCEMATRMPYYTTNFVFQDTLTLAHIKPSMSESQKHVQNTILSVTKSVRGK